MMTRVGKAKDWETGNELSMHLLGKLSRLEVHHVFRRICSTSTATAGPRSTRSPTSLPDPGDDLLVSDRDPASISRSSASIRT